MRSFELHIGRDWLIMSQLGNFLFQWLPSRFYSIAPRTVKLNAVFIIQSSYLNKCLLMSGKVFPSLVLIVAIHGCHHHGCYIHPRRIKRAFFPTTATDKSSGAGKFSWLTQRRKTLQKSAIRLKKNLLFKNRRLMLRGFQKTAVWVCSSTNNMKLFYLPQNLISSENCEHEISSQLINM